MVLSPMRCLIQVVAFIERTVVVATMGKEVKKKSVRIERWSYLERESTTIRSNTHAAESKGAFRSI
jgi:hypothetical protein